MKPRSALLAAIACGAVAVALVAVDLAFNVDARLEVRGADGTWRLSATTEAVKSYPTAAICGTHFRLTFHNGLLWSTSRHVTITVSTSGSLGSTTLLDETWSVGARSEKVHEFDVPNSTVETPNPNDSRAPFKISGSVQVSFGTGYANQLYAPACMEAKR
jgi:hypothetical protein